MGSIFYDARCTGVDKATIDIDRSYWVTLPARVKSLLNCPMTRKVHDTTKAWQQLKKLLLNSFEKEKYFEELYASIEVMAKRGIKDNAHGPMKPSWLDILRVIDPTVMVTKTPYAVVQLRQDNAAE